MKGSLGDDTLIVYPFARPVRPSGCRRPWTSGAGRQQGACPNGKRGARGPHLGGPYRAEFSWSGPAPASPVPAVPSSRSGTPRRSSRRLRKISCSFSKCSEEAAEVAMAQAARKRRPLRLRAQGPLPPQRSAARSRSHHRDSRTWAARNQALPGSFEQDALPLLSPHGRRAPKPDGKPGRDVSRLLQGRGAAAGTSRSLRRGDSQPG